MDGAGGSKGAAKAIVWRYTSPAGVETLTFKGNKLVSSTNAPKK
jgi:hypothetical protein